MTMIARFAHISILIGLFLVFAGVCTAQRNADGTSSLYPDSKETDKRDQPKSVREMLDKLRIEKEKKDYDAMLSRGEEALQISDQLEKAFETNEKLTNQDLAKLESLEKLVKKIRSELGGSDDDDTDPPNDDAFAPQSRVGRPNTVVEGFKALKETTVMLVDELKKTTRFTISAAAIQSTNAVLRLARFLRFKK